MARGGGAFLTSSTPDALWSTASARRLRPTAVGCSGIRVDGRLTGLTLSVPVGMRLLLVGDPPTAASALIRVLAGLVRASAGRMRLAGLDDPSIDGWGRRVAYLGPRAGIRPWMTPREVLSLATDLLGLSDPDAERRIARALAWTRIDPGAAERAVRHGGHALAERTALAAALVGDPEVLLLEDPLRSVALHERTRLLRLPGPRRTVILASRYPEREAGLFSHVALVRARGLAMLAPMAELESAGLPLSADGIGALARRIPRASGPVPPLREAARAQ